MRSKHAVSPLVGLIYLLVICFVFALQFAAGWLAPESSARKAAEVQGFTDIQVSDKAIMFIALRGCGSGDTARFSVRAKNNSGIAVDFFVCTGFFKGSTIRTM